jgi:hypothetical protein
MRRGAGIVRFLAVVLALAAQLSSGARTLPESEAASLFLALDTATIFCQAAHPSRPHDAPPARHRFGDAAILQANVRAGQAAILGVVPFVPSPNQGHIVRAAALPEARAPPSRDGVAAYPRGPPDLV